MKRRSQNSSIEMDEKPEFVDNFDHPYKHSPDKRASKTVRKSIDLLRRASGSPMRVENLIKKVDLIIKQGGYNNI